jgi:hypothetical protein
MLAPMKHLILFLAMAITLAAQAQTHFKDIFSGKTVPLSLKLKDLTGDWRRFTTGGAADASPAGISRTYAAILGGGSVGYYSRGETVAADGETYLIAYRMQTKPLDVAVITRGQPPAPEKPTPDSQLLLCLLHLRTLDSFADIRPFDLEVELAGGDTSPAALEEARDKAAKASGLQNLKAIGVALLAYAQDGDKTLPPMKDADATRKALEPYCKIKDAFKDPYTPNPSLSGRKLAGIEKPGEMVAFYETKPGGETRAVLYLDGRCERVAETRWPDLKKASQIP